MTRTRFTSAVAIGDGELDEHRAVIVIGALRELLTEALSTEMRLLWPTLHIGVEPGRRDGFVPSIVRMRIDGIDDE